MSIHQPLKMFNRDQTTPSGKFNMPTIDAPQTMEFTPLTQDERDELRWGDEGGNNID